jgi:hypothetical protein
VNWSAAPANSVATATDAPTCDGFGLNFDCVQNQFPPCYPRSAVKRAFYSLLLALLLGWASNPGPAAASPPLGVAESRFYLAFEHASRLLDYCGSLHPCGGKTSCKELQMCDLGMFERMLVEQAASDRAKELPAPQNIEFISGRERLGFFQIEGWHKIARTGSKPGEVISVNRDEIYRPNDRGEAEPLSYLEILEIVVHERMHHTGFNPAEETHTAIAQKITAIAQKFAYSATLGPGAENIRFQVLNTSDRTLPLFDVPRQYLLVGFLTVEDSEKVFTIEKGIRMGLADRSQVCIEYDRTDRTLCLATLPESYRIQTVQYFNVHWEDPPMPVPLDRKSKLRLVGTAVLHGIGGYDAKKKLVPATYSFQFAYDFQVEPKGSGLVISEDGFAVTRFRIQEAPQP